MVHNDTTITVQLGLTGLILRDLHHSSPNLTKLNMWAMLGVDILKTTTTDHPLISPYHTTHAAHNLKGEDWL